MQAEALRHNTSNLWAIAYKDEYQYDANGNQTMKISYDWDNTSNLWVIDYKTEPQYDANGNQTLEIGYRHFSPCCRTKQSST